MGWLHISDMCCLKSDMCWSDIQPALASYSTCIGFISNNRWLYISNMCWFDILLALVWYPTCVGFVSNLRWLYISNMRWLHPTGSTSNMCWFDIQHVLAWSSTCVGSILWISFKISARKSNEWLGTGAVLIHVGLANRSSLLSLDDAVSHVFWCKSIHKHCWSVSFNLNELIPLSKKQRELLMQVSDCYAEAQPCITHEHHTWTQHQNCVECSGHVWTQLAPWKCSLKLLGNFVLGSVGVAVLVKGVFYREKSKNKVSNVAFVLPLL